MTTGSIIQPAHDFVTQIGRRSATCAGVPDYTYSDGPMSKWGLSFSKTWSGTDFPSTKYAKKIYYFTFMTQKGRKQFRVKQKDYGAIVAGKLARKDEPHPYTMNLTMVRETIGRRTIHSNLLCPPWPPPFTNINYGSLTETYGTYQRYGGASWIGTWTSNDDIALLGRLREKIVGTSFDATVFLGEGREALDMIFNAATRIRKSLTQLKRGNVIAAGRELGILPDNTGRIRSIHFQTTGKGPKYLPLRVPPPGKTGTISETAAKVWLEWSYGWLPLVNDCGNAAEYLAARLQAPLYKEYRVSLKVPLRAQFSQDYVTTVQKGYIRTSILARLTEIDQVKLLGFTDPAAVIWELTPWSFVADWFIPIGNYLQARGLAQSISGTFVTTKVTRKYERANDIRDTRDVQGYLSNSFENNFYSRLQILMERTVSSSLNVPKPSFRNLSDVPSWKRAANAVSLLVLQFGSSGVRPSGRSGH
jgi:hypothetical protein